ncbi:hypothetical protein C3941_09385 [Kaistia algarum]|uniref:phage protease n=1 Tax=Kaistia algarum TaxID=2083279 RepID=UPI000CE79AE1|nr:phage protease [Kaistia algarum]MCX5512271.1 hypothetical protein [Kaistia algarum]PPE80362.1 hypothetical protein C3941_09385 [Kaistia algarum]
MTNRGATPSIGYFATLSALPVVGDVAPEWVQLFPASPAFETRDGRHFRIDDPAQLASVFTSEATEIPVDINHATEIRAPKGEEAEPVGWIKEIAIRAGLLCGRVEWTDKGKAAAKAYRYVSPSFNHDKSGLVTRIRSLALVAVPALAEMPALAAAHNAEPSELPMKSIALALGLTEAADEASCLSALTTLKTATVAKTIHDETVATLSATKTTLETLQASVRKGKVDALIEGALKAKKILPAQKDHYVGLCSTDAGLAQVEQLIAASPAQLAASGLDDRSAEDGDHSDPVALAAAATTYQQKLAAGGRQVSYSEAVLAVSRGAK